MINLDEAVSYLKVMDTVVGIEPIGGTQKAYFVTLTVENYGEVQMIIDLGSSNELWVQLSCIVATSVEDSVWLSAASALQEYPAVGLCRMGDMLVIRHGMLVEYSDIWAFTNGIFMTSYVAARMREVTFSN